MTRIEFLQRFQLHLLADYHPESKQRSAHVQQLSHRSASVLIGLVEREGRLHVILTKRAHHLKHHPGQISFPGGKVEDSDTSVYFTALREANEEIGIKYDEINIVGHLPDLLTITRFHVTPVVAFVDPGYQPQVDKNEVDYLFEVPLEFLAHTANMTTQRFTIKGANHRVLAIPYQSHFIWGVTAQIIESLQTQLLQQ
ncbi:CoA pyrophosphatase [Vibrio methylphosphonaticus]|uniref:CoA pyrophosphatase n=1 Tax=Vibrio methylphosphonaticus TaxID=2946866 RepID=UPI002029EF5E|nr:CoA pyrophosphatase [Vibrio methylphosphonaticus]MCL9775827.1 CoA pyrophosphatase [Vibrio methylphosphonaticus]